MTILGILVSVEMLGEELGWLGWLFPKLEKLHGAKAAILLLALILQIEKKPGKNHGARHALTLEQQSAFCKIEC